MAHSTKLKEAIAYLREEIPTRDVSKNPVVSHPHNTARIVPERLPAARIKELSQLNPGIAVFWTFMQWASIGAAIAMYGLALFGFDASPGASNGEDELFGLRFLFSTFPSLFFLCGALIVWNYPITEARHAEIRRDIERNEQASQTASQ